MATAEAAILCLVAKELCVRRVRAGVHWPEQSHLLLTHKCCGIVQAASSALDKLRAILLCQKKENEESLSDGDFASREAARKDDRGAQPCDTDGVAYGRDRGLALWVFTSAFTLALLNLWNLFRHLAPKGIWGQLPVLVTIAAVIYGGYRRTIGSHSRHEKADWSPRWMFAVAVIAQIASLLLNL